MAAFNIQEIKSDRADERWCSLRSSFLPHIYGRRQKALSTQRLSKWLTVWKCVLQRRDEFEGTAPSILALS